MPPIRLSPRDSQSTTDLRRDVNEILFRLDHAKQVAPTEAATGDPCPGFSGTGTATVGDVAAIWEASLPHTYTATLISCVSSGGATLDFDVEVNGSVIGTVSLASGETRALYGGFSVAPGDRLGGTVTASGGQIAISVQLIENA